MIHPYSYVDLTVSSALCTLMNIDEIICSSIQTYTFIAQGVLRIGKPGIGNPRKLVIWLQTVNWYNPCSIVKVEE